MYSLSVFGLGAYLLAVANAQNVISLAPAAQPTPGSSAPVSPSFAGFGIEPSNLYSFTGGTKPNALTMNLLQNLNNYTGTPPHIRLGGNTQDYMIYESNMNDYAVSVNPHPKTHGGWFPRDYFLFGPRFFEVVNERFPGGTPITYGLSMAYARPDYLNRTKETAMAAYKGMSKLNLQSFEIGNEPDLYIEAGYRNSSWSGAEYTQEWLTRANAVYQHVLRPHGKPSNFFEPACTASTIGTTFEIDMLIDDGITVKAAGSSGDYVAAFNQHDYYYYIGVSTFPLTLDYFMDLSTTNTQFSYWVSQIAQAHLAGYPYALREMGVVGPIGMDHITNVFGASLWTLNWFFYAATLNISSVNMHLTDNSNASAWQPIPYYGNKPFVRPNYYAWAAFDQTIGPTCQATISGYEIGTPPAGYEGRIGAYSVYQDGTLESIVIINSKVANMSTPNKGKLTIDLSLPIQFAGQALYLSYLSNSGADAKHKTTWNGLSFEQSGDGTPTEVADSVETVTIGGDGSVTVSVRDTQALVANIGRRVGTRTKNGAACAALAAAHPTATAIGPVAASDDGSTNDTVSSNGAGRSLGVGCGLFLATVLALLL